MYYTFYGLDKNPFELFPTGGLLYLSESHREALAVLRYGVISSQGFLLLTGGVGTGKTSVLNTLLKLLKDSVQVHVLNNPALSRNELYHYLSGTLGFKSQRNKGAFLLEFNQLLDKLKNKGERLLLIIDEAQAFSVGLLEEVRLLSNHSGDRKVLSIFLIGQPELQEVLADPRLLPMRQRIGVRYHLEALTREDTEQYIIYRLNKAGSNNPAIFGWQAIDAIHLASKGTPRLINLICDNALILGFSLGAKRIDREIVEDAIKDIKLPGERELQISPQPEKTKASSIFRKNQLWSALVAISALIALTVGVSLFYVLFLQRRLPPQVQTTVDYIIEFLFDFIK